MPQMMPINWMMSFINFLIIFIMFNILNYYIFNYKKNKFFSLNNKKKNNFFFYWKW